MTIKNTTHERIEEGKRSIHWTEMHMPLLGELKSQFAKERPFAGLTIGICIHVEPKTAVLCRTLQAGGANVVLTGSPGTTKDAVAAALQEEGITVYGQRADRRNEHLQNIHSVLRHHPHLLMDNGADLARTLIQQYDTNSLIGGTEETTTGANLLREETGENIPFPIIVINDSPLKRIMENEHGVGQTIIEGFMRTTNLILPTRRFVIVGYGTCGRGIARYLRNLGSQVVVVETDPIAGLEAALDGFRVARLEDTFAFAQVYVTVTGRPNAIMKEHFNQMNDGTILANAGHFSWEMDLESLRQDAKHTEQLTTDIEQFTLANGRRLILLTQGEMLNLAGGSGNPAETMDLGLSLQAASLLYLVQQRQHLSLGPQPVPHSVNNTIAGQMLKHLSYKM